MCREDPDFRDPLQPSQFETRASKTRDGQLPGPPIPLYSPTSMNLDRRSLLKMAGATVVATATSAPTVTDGGPLGQSVFGMRPEAAKWPGHQPGKIFLGCTSQPISETTDLTGRVGLYRSYHPWAITKRERNIISADHHADRLPWVSFKPPNSGAGAWEAVATGVHDTAIRARARMYAEFSRPVIVTFHHEPADNYPSQGAEFSAAWSRVHDIMKRETNLRNVVSVPIINEWAFNPINRRMDPRDWATNDILDRCHFFAVDLYQTKSGEGYDIRLGRVLDFLKKLGHSDKMVGVGETGSTNGFGNVDGAAWLKKQWEWSAANTSHICAISYYNSSLHNRQGKNWLLTESKEKLRIYRDALSSPSATTRLKP